MTATQTILDRADPSAYRATPETPPRPGADVAATLGLGGAARWRKRVVTLLLLGGAAAGGYALYQHLNTPPPPPTYRTAAATTGDVALSVGATGRIEPVRTVDVGAEISGRVVGVHADWNDRVESGQVLVTLDTEPLEAELAQARAQQDAAAASVRQAYATWVEARQADERARRMGGQGLQAAAATEAAAAARARAFASLEHARAQQKLSEARVAQSEANLEKAVIKAPIDGLILERIVEVGNAVASSLQTVVLFRVVEDLETMRLVLAVDEADIAQVEEGMKASFTVDAYPAEAFDAVVEQVRLAPTVDQNVVTYQVVVTVHNGTGKLRPGMTATATIESQRAEGVVRVPNAALRFTPPRDGAAGGARARGGLPFGGGRMRVPGGGRRGGPSVDEKRAQLQGAPGGGGARAGGRDRGPRVWVLRDGAPAPVRVSTGITDGAWTQITSDQLAAGDEVIVGLDEVAQ